MRPTVSEPKFVLIVEDDPDVTHLLTFHLHRQGYEVGHADDGQEALNAVFECRPDLVILDLMLPKLDGFEVCRMLKASPVARHIPILMLTARSETIDKVKGFDLGASDYMTKPFDIAELLARVRALLLNVTTAA